MISYSTESTWNRCVPALVAVMLLMSAGAAVAQEVCEGFDKYHRIERMGGKNAFSKTPAETAADFQRLFEENWSDFEPLMQERGIGDLAQPLLETVRAGKMSERDLQQGEEFYWMVWRRAGVPKSSGPLCVATAKPYSAWVVRVEVVKETGEAVYTTPHTFVFPKICMNLAYLGAGDVETVKKPSICEISATRCEAEMAGLAVDASGSSAGAQIVMVGGDGSSQVVVPAGSSTLTWKGADADPYHGEVTFKVVGPEGRCEKSVSLPACEAPDPWCEIEAPSRVRTKQQFALTMKGHKEIELQVADAAGNTLSAGDPMALTRPGAFVVTGTATNEAGETATCSAQVSADPRWTFRPFLADVDPTGDMAREEFVRPNGVSASSALSVEGGFGGGAALEYHFNRTTGLEGAFIYARLQSHFNFALDGHSDGADADVGALIFTLGPNFHLTPNARADLYVQPFLGIAQLDDVSYSVLGETQSRELEADGLGYGMKLGVDIPFGPISQWGFHLGASYLALGAEVESGGDQGEVELDFNPFSLYAGFAYSF